jgi:hypothetical protein
LNDVFVTKLNSVGTGLIYSTYIGGSSNDYGSSIAIDGSGNAYITGDTYSNAFDITPGSFQTNIQGGHDAYVTKINSSGTALIYSTYIGGSYSEFGYYIAIDGSGNAYITGRTTSTDFDITLNAFQTTFSGGTGSDVFVTKLNSTGNSLIYSTYIGGSNEDNGSSIAIDGSGNAYVTGWTNSTDFDISSGAFQTTNGGGYDVFVTKLDLGGNSSVETLVNKDALFSIFPNPNKGVFTIQFEKGGEFELMDITGRIIKTYIIKNEQKTIHENLPAGMYFVREKESGALQKLIVN